MIRLSRTLAAWNKPDFESVVKNEIERLDHKLLPLQQGLAQSNYVSDSPLSASILNVSEHDNELHVKAGILYSGIIAGSCCSDDPTPLCEQPEYCELLFVVNKNTAETQVLPFIGNQASV